MKKLLYSELTDDQRDFLSNGCGGKGGPFWAPQFVFEDSCDHHDFHYWRGCTRADRKLADRSFLRSMLFAASATPWPHRWLYQGLAVLYYSAVRAFGWRHFYYGPTMRTKDELRTRLLLETAREFEYQAKSSRRPGRWK